MTSELEDADLTSDEKNDEKYSFLAITKNDPNLALAGLRIEIEKRLQELAKKNNIMIERRSVMKTMFKLIEGGIINKEEASVFSDLLPMLSSAVHGADVPKDASKWAFETGSRILAILDRKIAQQ